MQNELKKKYGLFTAISMVVGIVIGSGVFFKAEKVLIETNGNIPLGIIAWGLVGMIMIICSFAFATMATRHEKINGVVDYADVYVNRKYGYFMGWFMAVIYKPTLTSVLAWVSARYTCVLLNWDITGGSCMVIAGFYLIAIFALNSLSPILSGRFQVTTTIIKLIPLILMAVAGTIVDLQNGMTMENFNRTAVETVNTGGGLFAAVVAVAFAYEGWIIATSINSEIRDSKKNLPLALMIGAFIVVIVYILYYIGLAGAVPAAELMANGQAGAKLAFQNIFGQVAGTLIFVFIIISCL
ncbi:MAG: amino acid permease, partial [Clostridiales bacterium]|nr:amino acid permease [Clostridiales bacterium]